MKIQRVILACENPLTQILTNCIIMNTPRRMINQANLFIGVLIK